MFSKSIIRQALESYKSKKITDEQFHLHLLIPDNRKDILGEYFQVFGKLRDVQDYVYLDVETKTEKPTGSVDANKDVLLYVGVLTVDHLPYKQCYQLNIWCFQHVGHKEPSYMGETAEYFRAFLDERKKILDVGFLNYKFEHHKLFLVGHNIDNYDYTVLWRYGYLDPKKYYYGYTPPIPTIDTYRLALTRLSSISDKSFRNLSLGNLASEFKIPLQKIQNFDYRVLRVDFLKYGDRFELVGDEYKILVGQLDGQSKKVSAGEFIDIYEYLILDLLSGFFLFSRIYSDIYGSVFFLGDFENHLTVGKKIQFSQLTGLLAYEIIKFQLGKGDETSDINNNKTIHEEYKNIFGLYRNRDLKKYYHDNNKPNNKQKKKKEEYIVEEMEDEDKIVVEMEENVKVKNIEQKKTYEDWFVDYMSDRGVVIKPGTPKFNIKQYRNYLIARKKNDGGYVHTPNISFWPTVNLLKNPVIVSLDFNSLYPHIIMLFNLFQVCHCKDGEYACGNCYKPRGIFADSQVRIDPQDNEYQDMDENIIGRYRTGKIETGIEYKIIAKLYGERTDIKKRMVELYKAELLNIELYKPKNPNSAPLLKSLEYKQMIIKFILNTIYGIMDQPQYACTFNHVGRSDCTAIGRRMIKFVRWYLRYKGYYVVYGDTDSVFVACDDAEKLAELDGHVEEMKNQMLGDAANPGVYTHKLATENHISNIWFFSDRNGKYKKKNYIYRTVGAEPVKSKIVCKGLTVIKKSASVISRKIFDDHVIVNYVRKQIPIRISPREMSEYFKKVVEVEPIQKFLITMKIDKERKTPYANKTSIQSKVQALLIQKSITSSNGGEYRFFYACVTKFDSLKEPEKYFENDIKPVFGDMINTEFGFLQVNWPGSTPTKPKNKDLKESKDPKESMEDEVGYVSGDSKLPVYTLAIKKLMAYIQISENEMAVYDEALKTSDKTEEEAIKQYKLKLQNKMDYQNYRLYKDKMDRLYREVKKEQGKEEVVEKKRVYYEKIYSGDWTTQISNFNKKRQVKYPSMVLLYNEKYGKDKINKTNEIQIEMDNEKKMKENILANLNLSRYVFELQDFITDVVVQENVMEEEVVYDDQDYDEYDEYDEEDEEGEEGVVVEYDGEK